LCALGAVFTVTLLTGRPREPSHEGVQTVALSFARCPGAPYCGALTRMVAIGRHVRRRAAPS
jgi:hypothetical protein